MSELYTCTPRKAKEFIIDCVTSGLVPFVQSSPGIGKSSIMREIANEHNLKMIDHRLSTSEPSDLTGLPRFVNGFAEFVPFADLFPVESTPLPEGKDGFMLFMDEFNSASKAVQGASYKLILDRMTGQHRLHERCIITAAGNLATDRAIVNPISTAMQSRLVHIHMVVSFKEWLEDVAIKQNYDPRIISFLSQFESKLMDFRPDHHGKTFASPRTWEFMNRLIKGKEVTEDKAALYAGTITSEIAAEFVQYTKVFASLVPLKVILADPENCAVPADVSLRYATVTTLLEQVSAETFDPICKYIRRFDMSFQILFFRSAMIRQPQLREHPSFALAMSALARYIY